MKRHATRINTFRAIILAGFVLLSFIYASAAPILEKNDEDHHLAMVIHFANGGGMPVQQTGEQTPWMQEGSQPPLYYWLASLPARFFDTSDFEYQARPNASPQYAPFFPSNKNKHLLTPQKFAFAYLGSMLAAYVLRVMGILAGVAAIWFTFKLGERATGKPHIALLAMGVVAFNPMLLTVTTAVSNDGLVIALSAAAMWLLATCLMDRITTPRAVMLGILLGLASLTKVSGTVLLPIAGAALIAHAILIEKRSLLDWRSYRFAFVIALLWLAIAGWWFARNLLLYGELAGTTTMVQVAGPRTEAIDIIGEFRAFRMTFIGIFGQTNVPMPMFVYVLWDVFLVAALLGVSMALWTHRRSLPANRWLVGIAMAAHILLVIASAVLWTTMVPASHGRLLFPALPSIAVFLAIGIAQLMRLIRLPERATAWAMLPFAAIAVAVPFISIAPAYQPPIITALPADATPAKLTMSPFAEVIGYRMTPNSAKAGDTVRVAVFMRALQPTPSNFLLSTQMYGRDDAPLARFDTYTGGGLLPSSQWQAGQMWVDEMDLRIPAGAQAPGILRLQFALFNAYSGQFAKNIDASGNAGSPLFDGATLLPETTPPITKPLATFGNLVALHKVEHSPLQAGAPITLTLQWQPLAQAPRNYTVFVHLIDDKGNLVAQSDSPPDAGQFPSMRWVKDATFTEQRVLNVPADAQAGRYRLSFGLYDPQTGERLPAVDAQGAALSNSIYTAVPVDLSK